MPYSVHHTYLLAIFAHQWLHCVLHTNPFRFDLIYIKTFGNFSANCNIFRGGRMGIFIRKVCCVACVSVSVSECKNYSIHWTAYCAVYWDIHCVWVFSIRLLGNNVDECDRWHDDMSIFISTKIKVFFISFLKYIFKFTVTI